MPTYSRISIFWNPKITTNYIKKYGVIKAYELQLEQILEYSFLQRQLIKFWPVYKRYFRKKKKHVIRKQRKRLHKKIVTKIYLNNSRNWYFSKKHFITKWTKNVSNLELPYDIYTIKITSVTKWLI